jgi:hypothetical protein
LMWLFAWFLRIKLDMVNITMIDLTPRIKVDIVSSTMVEVPYSIFLHTPVYLYSWIILIS